MPLTIPALPNAQARNYATQMEGCLGALGFNRVDYLSMNIS